MNHNYNNTINSSGRFYWIDTLKFLAAFWVLFAHFISGYTSSTFLQSYRDSIVGFIFKGISGKLCVALFCIFIGFFAFEKSNSTTIEKYISSRYLQFVKYIVIPNLVKVIYIIIVYYFFADYIGQIQLFVNDDKLNISHLAQTFFSDSLFFSSGLLPALWCLPAFFIGSIVVFTIGLKSIDRGYSVKKQIAILLSIYFLCIFANQVWISNCILGGMLRVIINANYRIFKHWYVLLGLFIIMICGFRWLTESYITYIAYGIACFSLTLICYYCQPLQNILNIKVFSHFLGHISFEMYLVHPLVLQIFTIRFTPFLMLHFIAKVTFIISFIATCVICIIAAYILKNTVRCVMTSAEVIKRKERIML